MTIARRDDRDTAFSAWIRNQPELDSTRCGYDLEDIDEIIHRYIWHKYLAGCLMLLETKEFNAERSYAQRDTQSIVDQALRFAFNHPDFSVRREHSKRPTKIKYSGYHLIQFERTSPDDGRVRIDGISVTNEQLLRFLKFEWIPRRDATIDGRLRSVLDEIGQILNQAFFKYEGDDPFDEEEA